tara:strand:- start:2391 stop:4310 length:1920 start_codon:yes stop_codon:yes gene_type:complete
MGITDTNPSGDRTAPPQTAPRHRRGLLTAPLLRFAMVLALGLGVGAALLMAIHAGGGALAGFAPISWWQLAVGFGALFISGWVWSLRPGDLAARLFYLSGLATQAFTFAPIPFSVAGFEASNTSLQALSVINGAGASAFGVAMVAFFLVYPNRLPGWRWIGTATVVVFGAWSVAYFTGHVPASPGMHLVTLMEMVAIFAALAAQYVAARDDPKARAILIWLGGSVAIGAGSFIALVSLPNSLGFGPLIDARLAFGFFLVIYLGCAAGLARYRLFELGDWAFRGLFYAVGAVLLVAIDALLIFLLPLSQASALAVTLIAVTLIYLPLRDMLSRWLLKRANLTDQDMLREVIDTAFAPAQERAGRWLQTLRNLFNPLEYRAISSAEADVRISEEGLAMTLPALAGSPALELRYPWKGQGLFGPRHARTAQQLIALMRQAEESRAAHERGVSEERSRIARDMHDNIGAQLLGALHSQEAARKDSMIRETLTGLRDIINNASPAGVAVTNLAADLRAETAERVAASCIALVWNSDIAPGSQMTPAALHALRSVVRESVSNVIRHSGAGRLEVHLRGDETGMTLTVIDDGKGFDVDGDFSGKGLDNMKSRLDGLNGQITFKALSPGTHVTAWFPTVAATEEAAQ